MFKSILALSCVLLGISVHAADERFPGIETLMTADERRAAGIDSLSPEQLDALNAWVVRYTTDSAGSPVVLEQATPVTESRPAATSSNQPAAPAPPIDDFRQPPERVDFVSRIAGEFNGWEGRTLFTLENGQVWEQRRGNRWKISLDSPEVRIRQNFMGAYEMEVLSEGRSIGVRRIR